MTSAPVVSGGRSSGERCCLWGPLPPYMPTAPAPFARLQASSPPTAPDQPPSFRSHTTATDVSARTAWPASTSCPGRWLGLRWQPGLHLVNPRSSIERICSFGFVLPKRCLSRIFILHRVAMYRVMHGRGHDRTPGPQICVARARAAHTGRARATDELCPTGWLRISMTLPVSN